MRIDRLEVKNFKGFAERVIEFPRPVLTPEGESPAPGGSFHVVIGENGSGKTSLLDALAVALGVWLVKVPDSSLASSRRPILPGERRVDAVVFPDRTAFQEAAGGVSVKAFGEILGQKIAWEQRLGQGAKRASNSHSKDAIQLIQAAYERVRNPESRSQKKQSDAGGTTSFSIIWESVHETLPVIAYYGAGRTWLPHRERQAQRQPSPNGPARRWAAFYDCLNERIRLSDLRRWFETEAIERGNRRGDYRPGFEVIRRAVLHSVPGADDLWFDGDRREIVLSIDRQAQPLGNLSAGQQVLMALVADLAIKMVTQNSFLVPGGKPPQTDEWPRVLRETPGVVLIDELDVHLHPKWQREVISRLRFAFPRIQFIATTHSPFIVQSANGEELVNLQGQTLPELGNYGVEEIAQGLMGVERPDTSPDYRAQVEAGKEFLSAVNEAVAAPPERRAILTEKLAQRRQTIFPSNPAFQAFLELQQAAALGGARSAEVADPPAGGR